MKKRKAAELIFDFDLYPRPEIDPQNVANIVEGLRAGIELPPVIIDAKSLRLIDGFHRVRAVLRFNGDDAEIMCIEKNYRNEKDMFLDAMKYNATHGRRLTSYDRAYCIIKSQHLKIGPEDLARVLSMTVEKIDKLTTDRIGKLRVVGKGERSVSPLKRTIQHMAGKTLSKQQLAANEKLSGMDQKFYVNQVILLITAGLLDETDKDLVPLLAKLHGLLSDLDLQKSA